VKELCDVQTTCQYVRIKISLHKWSGGTAQLRRFRGNTGYKPFRKWALISLNNAHKPERKVATVQFTQQMQV